jgi:anti-sigma B factor antagonist
MSYQESPASAPGALVVVKLPVEIDVTNAEDVGDDLCAAFQRGVRVVVADMTMTKFCDSSGVRNLVMASRHAAAGHDELRIAVPSAAVLRVLTVLGADRVLHLYPTLAEAVTVGSAA